MVHTATLDRSNGQKLGIRLGDAPSDDAGETRTARLTVHGDTCLRSTPFLCAAAYTFF